MNNNLDYILGMYIPETDSVISNLANNMTIELSCKKCHSNIISEEPANIASQNLFLMTQTRKRI